ncbi:MAG: N-6 DNA methylase [Balneolaceae bacterium]|nr:N-6 DNA methylase [Balneolaceae bacterium]
MASKEQFLKALEKPYDRILFARDVLKPVFGSSFTLETDLRPTREEPNKTEKQSIKSVGYYGTIQLDDGRKVTCYEVVLQPSVRIEQSKVTIQQYVRKLLTAGQAALVNFVASDDVAPEDKTLWRFTLVAKDSEITEDGVKEKLTHAKRYTYLVEANRPNRTLAERLEILGSAKDQNLDALTEAFSVEKLSDAFFDEYKGHYQNFVEYLTGKRMVKEKGKWKEKKTDEPSAFLKSVFNGNEKAARDFCKKLMGRLVFLYFVQRKRWLGATNQQYKDGNLDFIFNLFQASGGDDSFYPNWLSPLFFDTLNNNQRINEEYQLPDGTTVHIPFLNGGLFDKDKVDEKRLTFPTHLFHNSKNPDSPKERGFLDFLNAFNFTVYEDSPDDHTVAVDPEMLGHIFENLLEENKEKGAFYTPKEIVHYMCRESLIEYLTTHLEKEYTVYKEVGDQQVQLFGNDGKTGQLNMMEKLGDKALDKADVERIVKEKDIAGLTSEQILRIDNLLDTVKICDPAIGSGAFPMGLLQEIFSIKEIIAYELELEWKPAKVKENIIQRSIYGVDIEGGAVDIARLRFWLSLLVDSEDPKPLPNLEYKIVVGNSLISMFEEEPLEIDWEIKEGSQSNMFGHDELLKRQELLKQITKTQKDYFHADVQKKRQLSLQIRNQKIDLLMNQLSLMIQTKGEENKPTGSGKKAKKRMERWLDTQNWKRIIRMLKDLREHPEKPFNHFDWKLDFPEVLNEQVVKEKGFDILIANPPYVKEYTNKAAFDGFRDSSYYEGKMDLWYGFACIGIDMLKEKGVECCIAQNNWVTSGGASKMRKKVLSDTKILKLVDFGSYEIFNNASIQTMVMLFQKDKKSDDYRAEIFRIEKQGAEFSDVISILNEVDKEGLNYLEPKINRKFLDGEYLTFSNAKVSDLLVKIAENKNFNFESNEVGQGIVAPQDFVNKDHAEELGNTVVKGQGIFNLSTTEKKSINWNEAEEELIKPFYTSNELHRYYGQEENMYWVIYTDSSFGAKFSGSTKNPPADLNQYPNIVSHLDQFKKVITSDWKPYGLHRARDEKFFTDEKIISLRKCSDRPTFTYTDFPCYVSQTYFVIKPANLDLIYLTGLLNSRLIMFWLKHKGKMQGNNFQVDKAPIMNIPIYKPENDTGIADLVDQILAKKESNPEADISEEEQQIDLLVYKLYNLTWEEVKVVDPDFEKSEE